jgi:hypothetical protein
MHPDRREATVSRLQALADQNPQEAMDELESLVRCTSVRDLTEILQDIFGEISKKAGIDWHFTALQWKLGNTGREQFLDVSHQVRFMVWTFPCQGERTSRSETRYTTFLPFCFKPGWIPRRSKVAQAETWG